MRSLLEAKEYHLADCVYRRLSPKTIRAYTQTWDDFIRWCQTNGEGLTLHSLNAPNVKACANWVGTRRQGKRGNQSARLAFVACIKVAAKFLVDEDILEADTLAKVKRPKVDKGTRHALDAWEIQAIRGALSASPFAARNVAMFALSLDTGVRIEELCGLTLDRLDLESYRITVVGKGRRERVIPFGSAERGGGKTARLVKEYLKVRPDAPTDRLWLGLGGHPLTQQGWRRAFKLAAKEAGIPDRVPHELRHTFATRWIVRNWDKGDGARIETLRYLMGHLSDDEYRTYSQDAGRLISDMAGRESLYEAMDEPVRLQEKRAAYSNRRGA